MTFYEWGFIFIFEFLQIVELYFNHLYFKLLCLIQVLYALNQMPVFIICHRNLKLYI